MDGPIRRLGSHEARHDRHASCHHFFRTARVRSDASRVGCGGTYVPRRRDNGRRDPADADAETIAATLAGILTVAGETEQRDQAARMLSLLVDGLRPIV